LRRRQRFRVKELEERIDGGLEKVEEKVKDMD